LINVSLTMFSYGFLLTSLNNWFKLSYKNVSFVYILMIALWKSFGDVYVNVFYKFKAEIKFVLFFFLIFEA